MTEIGDAGAGNEPHISRADHCNAHRFCSSAGRLPRAGDRTHHISSVLVDDA